MTRRPDSGDPGAVDARVALGRAAEAFAERHLASRGWTLLDRRFRRSFGEIDLVFDDDGTVVFVEVRSRTRWGLGRPAETVGPAKQRTLCRVALAWLQARRALARPCRFDVVEVRPQAGNWRLHHWPDAFRPGPPRRGRRY